MLSASGHCTGYHYGRSGPAPKTRRSCLVFCHKSYKFSVFWTIKQSCDHTCALQCAETQMCLFYLPAGGGRSAVAEGDEDETSGPGKKQIWRGSQPSALSCATETRGLSLQTALLTSHRPLCGMREHTYVPLHKHWCNMDLRLPRIFLEV